MNKICLFVALIAILVTPLVGCTPATPAPTEAPAATPVPPAEAPAATPVPPTVAPPPTEDPEAAKIAGAKAEGEFVSYGMTDDWVNLGAIFKIIQ